MKIKTGKKFSKFIEENYTEEQVHFLNFMWKKIRDAISDPINPPLEIQIDCLGAFYLSKNKIKVEIRRLIRYLRDSKTKEEVKEVYTQRLNYLFKNRHNGK